MCSSRSRSPLPHGSGHPGTGGAQGVGAAWFIRNDRLADALHRQAQSALTASPGARAFYAEQRDRGLDHDAALRTLSNRLVGILHGCLKTRSLYDEATAWSHRKNRDRGLTTKAQGVSADTPVRNQA